MRALQILEHAFGGCARAGAFRQGVLHNLIFAACRLHRAAQLGVVFDGDALKGGQNHGRHLRELGLQIVQVLLLFALLLHNSVPQPVLLA